MLTEEAMLVIVDNDMRNKLTYAGLSALQSLQLKIARQEDTGPLTTRNLLQKHKLLLRSRLAQPFKWNVSVKR